MEESDMEKNVRDFLINMVATSFSDIGYAMRILLGDGNTTENEALIRKAESADDRIQFLKALADKASEEEEKTAGAETTPQSEAKEEKTEEKPRAKRKAAKAEKPVEAKEKEAEPVANEKADAETPEAAATAAPAAEVAAGTPSEAPAPEVKAEEPQKPAEEPKHKTTLTEVRKMMTDLSRRGKGAVVQKVLADFKVTKLSDVKEDDYDDFITKVLYFADELEAVNA